MGPFSVVHRNGQGDPVVIEKHPFSMTEPQCQRYWLVGTDETYAVAVLEANGGVRRAERTSMKISSPPPMIDIRFLEKQEFPKTTKVRCHLEASGAHVEESNVCTPTTPVFSQVKMTRSASGCIINLDSGCGLELNDPETTVVIEGTTFTIPTQMSAINERLAHGSYADPAGLTNIIGEITDAFDDALRIHDLGRPHDIDLAITGPYGQGLARLESGSEPASTRQSIEIQQKNCSACSQPTTQPTASTTPDFSKPMAIFLERCVSWSPSGGSNPAQSILARRPRHDSIPTPSLESSDPVGKPPSTAATQR